MAENLEENASLIVSAVNEATATLNDIQKGFENFEKSASSLGITSVALGGILKDIAMKAFEELTQVVKLGIAEAIDAEQQQVKLANSFKAEGAAAADSVKSVNEMAESLGELVGVDNDVIVATATTLRQISGLSAEMINKAMPAIADLAIRTGSLESAAMTVSRAMNGQSRQLKMLGIDFETTGDKGADLENLLGKINEKFGGQAQANMATTGGQIQELKIIFTDVAQEIGNTIIQSGLFKLALDKIKDGLIGIKEALSGNKQSTEYIKNLTASTTEAGKAYTDLAAAVNLSDEALAKLSVGAKGINEIKKKSAEQLALEASQLKTIAAFNEKNETAKRVAILENQAAATNADAAAREQRANELIQQSELAESIKITNKLKQESAEADLERARALAAYNESQIVHNFILTETDHLVKGLAGSITNELSNGIYLFISGTGKGLHIAQVMWQSFTNSVLHMLSDMIAKTIVFATVKAIANLVTGPIGDIPAGAQVASDFMQAQTAEGSTRLVPGPPNMMVPIMAHGGETIGRPSGGEGGMQVVVQGDYYESEEANGRLFDRLYNYQKRTGVSFGV